MCITQMPGFRCSNDTSSFISKLHWSKIMLIFLNEIEHRDEDRNTHTVFLLHCPPTHRIVPDAWVKFGRMNKHLVKIMVLHWWNTHRSSSAVLLHLMRNDCGFHFTVIPPHTGRTSTDSQTSTKITSIAVSWLSLQNCHCLFPACQESVQENLLYPYPLNLTSNYTNHKSLAGLLLSASYWNQLCIWRANRAGTIAITSHAAWY